jgi:hypothetical protein
MPRPQLNGDTAIITRPRNKRRKPARKSGGTQRDVEKFAGDAYSLASRAVAGLNSIRKLINIETRVLDFDVAGQSISTTPTVTYASGIAQGTDIGNRVGDSIKVQHLEFCGRLAINSSATFSAIRVLLVRDMENAGAAPAATDILETVSGTVTTRSPLNYLNKKRFSVLYDNFTVLDTASAYTQPVRMTMPLDRHISYRGTGGTVSAAAEGALFWLFVSDEATNTPTISVYTQVWYTDD